MLHHGIQHLGRRDNHFSGAADFLDNHLLDDWNILKRNLYTHVAAGNHDTIGNADDLVNVLHALHVLDLCNDMDVLAAFFFENPADCKHVIRAAHERGCNKIIVVLHRKYDVAIVFLADVRHGKLHVRNIHTFFIGNHTAVHNGTDNIHRHFALCICLCAGYFLDLLDFQTDQSVIDQNGISRLHIVRQFLICDRHTALITHDVLRRQSKCLSVLQLHLAACELFQTDLRTLCIQQSRDRTLHLPAQLAKHRKSSKLLLVSSM